MINIPFSRTGSVADLVVSKGFRMDQHPEVYIVDDDPGARRALAVVVASMQLNAVECANAEDFLNGYTEDHPSCLITDLRMRGMSGLDLLRHLKAEGRVIPTVIVTGVTPKRRSLSMRCKLAR